LAFEFVEQHMKVTFVNYMGAFGFVTKLVYAKTVAFAKKTM